MDETPLWIVETDEKLAEMAKELAEARVIGVDTESDSFHSYQEKVCLLQFTDHKRDYIVDPLAVTDLSPLAPFFADPEVVKIFHGADYDVVCMKRDFGFEIHNIFDTMISSQMLGFTRIGLADLILRFFGVEVDKQYQRHDWSKRPLRDEHLEYARGDTHYLLALRELLTLRLKRMGRLGHVEEECELLEHREWEARPFDPDGYLRIKNSGHLDDTSKRVLRRLYLYRDSEARRMNRPTFKVLADGILVKVAKARPTDDAALERLFPKKSSMKRRFGDGMLQAVREGLEDDFEIPTTKRRSKPKPEADKPRPRVTSRAADKAFNALKDWRNELCNTSPLHTPVTVASNSVLKMIAQQRPESIEELAEVPDVRRWQVREHGETILRILDEAAPMPESAAARTSKKRRRK